jgi:hypothetical protein
MVVQASAIRSTKYIMCVCSCVYVCVHMYVYVDVHVRVRVRVRVCVPLCTCVCDAGGAASDPQATKDLVGQCYACVHTCATLPTLICVYV